MMFKHVNLVRHLAWSFHRSTGIEWKELFSEACVIYFEVVGFRDAEKGAETTWLYRCIQNRLINFCKKEQRFQNPTGIDDWYVNTTDVFQELFHPELKLSEDTKAVIEMVLQDHLRYALPPQKAIVLIRRDLQLKKKWTGPRAWTAMRNLAFELLYQNIKYKRTKFSAA
jgi:DNA-directed RNA polymerase specialized sigma24 family protein